MKGAPAVPRGPLTSMPTWSNTPECFTTSAFFSLSVARDSPPRRKLMNKLKSNRSQEIDPTAGDGVAGDGVAGDGVAGDGVAGDGVAGDGVAQAQRPGTKPMNMSNSAMAEQIAQVAIAFEQRRTGHLPQSATVVLSENTLVITLHGALS